MNMISLILQLEEKTVDRISCGPIRIHLLGLLHLNRRKPSFPTQKITNKVQVQQRPERPDPEHRADHPRVTGYV